MRESTSVSDELSRYSKQVLFAGIGEAGQRRLSASRVFVCGCGALGSVIADTLVRAGVGFVRIVDRDFVEMSNLQRQVLFDESDVENRLPKAIAAAEKLRRINGDVTIEPIVADVEPSNVLDFVRDVDLVLDGTDNFEVRYLLNDAAHETGTPWIYAGVVGSHGQTMPIFPGRTACLRCLLPEAPDAAGGETCDTAGVIAPAVNVVSSLSCVEALKILSGGAETAVPMLTVVDVWEGTFRRMSLAHLRDGGNCPACDHGRRDWLNGTEGSRTTTMCGRNAVQVSPSRRGEVSFDALAERLANVGEVRVNPYLLRLSLSEPERELTVFRDGRAIVKGTEDPIEARTLYSRYLGQ